MFDKAIQQLSTARAKIGATENRLQVTISNLATSTQNRTSAESQITDVDIASATSTMTQEQVLQQAGVLEPGAQANQIPRRPRSSSSSNHLRTDHGRVI